VEEDFFAKVGESELFKTLPGKKFAVHCIFIALRLSWK
jgi:hypothetical protein